jgi:hypothetical protein
MNPQKQAVADSGMKLLEPGLAKGDGLFMTPEEVRDLLRLPSEDQARRFIAKLPESVRVQNVGRRVLVKRAELLAHLGM